MRQGTPDGAAEDLAQETMLAVWRKADRFDPAKAAASTWIFAVARNLRIDALRRDKRPEIDPDDPLLVAEPEPAADRTVEAGETEARVRAVLDELPEEQRHVVALSFFDELSHSEIAERLGLPLGTVKSRMRLAFARVRSALGDDE